MDMNIESETVARIWAWWAKKGKSEAPRRYLGASVAGHECDRYLWLHFRGLFRERFEGRMYRLFERGRREEEQFIAELRGIGCEVWDRDEGGQQFAVSALGGHFGGHLDAVVRGVPEAPKTPHVAEFKTHNDQSYKKLMRVGVQEAKPMHYCQMQIYMGMMKIDRALYLAVNKDDDDLYAQRVHFDNDFFKAAMRRVERIITEPSAERCAQRRDDWRCKLCPARVVCWHETGTVFSRQGNWSDCRSCCHASADIEGDGARWTCRLGKTCVIGSACNCADHLALPVLVDAEVDTATERSVTYRVGNQLVTNGTANGQFTTEELANIGREPLEHGAVQKIKEVFEEAKVVRQNAIKTKFEKFYGDVPPLFEGTLKELKVYMARHNWQVSGREEIDGIEYLAFDQDCTMMMVDRAHDKAIVQSDLPF